MNEKKKGGKPRRQLPYTQGSIKKITEYFLKPLINHKPSTMNLRQFLERVFHTADREITRYDVIQDFSFYGKNVNVPLSPVTGQPSGMIKPGRKQIWTRIDSTHDDRVDVEIYGGKGSKTKVFQMTAQEFRKKVLPFVQKVVLPEREQRYLVGNAWVLAKRLRKD